MWYEEADQAFEFFGGGVSFGRDVLRWSVDFEIFQRWRAFFKVRCITRRSSTHHPNGKKANNSTDKELHFVSDGHRVRSRESTYISDPTEVAGLQVVTVTRSQIFLVPNDQVTLLVNN